MRMRATSVPVTIKRYKTFNEEYRTIFNGVREILQPYKKWLSEKVDARTYELWTEKEFRTNSFHPRRRQGILFAGIKMWTSHVGFYFHPLYLNENFKEMLDGDLKDAFKGTAVFHITTISDSLSDNLTELLERGFRFYETEGFVRKRR